MSDYWLSGAADLHVHSAPDVYERKMDDIALATEARDRGMRALLLKSHHTLTADRAAIARTYVPGIAVFGGLALNQTVGGLNPVAVETAVAFGAKQIWMPTLHAAHCLEVAEHEMFLREREMGREGIRVADAEGQLDPAVMPILEIVRDADIILGTGHIAPEESLVLLAAAADLGISRLLVTHPLMSFTRFTRAQLKRAVELGGVLEFDRLECIPSWKNAVDPAETAAAIREVGAENCVMGSDGGQASNPRPPQMLVDFADALAEEGLTREELRRMMVETPARLLDL